MGYAAPSTIDQTTAGMSQLGCGINAATGTYLAAYLERIVDPAKLANCVQLIELNSSTSTMIADESSYDYLVEQTATTGISGNYAGFSG